MDRITPKDRERLKIFWFSRWISTSYADEHLDKNMKHQSEEGFDRTSELSVLNRETGYWYIDRMKYFEKNVFSNMLEIAKERGSLKETLGLLRWEKTE
jgi:uncharacterized protein YwqG